MCKSLGRPEYSIAAVSKLTGVSCHALRVWERRYGFPVPERSESGHRRYGQDQVSVLRALSKLARSGRSIGELIGDYLSGSLDLRAMTGAKVDERTPSAQVVDRLFEGDLASAETLLDRMAERLSKIELIERVIEPALVDIGERWFRKECDVYQEHCAVCMLILRLYGLLDQARRENPAPRRTILTGTVQGNPQEGSVLMVSVALELFGWRALTMGVELSVGEYYKAIHAWHPDALVLSFDKSGNINKRFQELSKIKDIPIFVIGRNIVNHQGLARRHGLIPLTGSLTASSSQMMVEVDAWERRRPRSASS